MNWKCSGDDCVQWPARCFQFLLLRSQFGFAVIQNFGIEKKKVGNETVGLQFSCLKPSSLPSKVFLNSKLEKT